MCAGGGEKSKAARRRHLGNQVEDLVVAAEEIKENDSPENSALNGENTENDSQSSDGVTQ